MEGKWEVVSDNKIQNQDWRICGDIETAELLNELEATITILQEEKTVYKRALESAVRYYDPDIKAMIRGDKKMVQDYINQARKELQKLAEKGNG